MVALSQTLDAAAIQAKCDLRLGVGKSAVTDVLVPAEIGKNQSVRITLTNGSGYEIDRIDGAGVLRGISDIQAIIDTLLAARGQ